MIPTATTNNNDNQINIGITRSIGKRRVRSACLLDSLYWRSCLPSTWDNIHGDGGILHGQFFNTWSTHWSRSSLQLLESIEIQSSHKTSPVVSLDLDAHESRFLLSAGSKDCTICVYDLVHGYSNTKNSIAVPSSYNNNDDSNKDGRWHNHKQVFQPVAQSCKVSPRHTQSFASSTATAGYVPHGHSYSPTVVKFYPTDSGAFLSTDCAGNCFIWDTNTFTPVFVSHVVSPSSCSYLSSSSSSSASTYTAYPQVAIQAMALPQQSHTLAALGCRSSSPSSTSCTSNHFNNNKYVSASSYSFDENVIRLMDIKTGSIVHQLTGHTCSAAAAAAGGGIGTVQYFPFNDFLLASGGTDATIRFWDIRKAGKRALLQTLDRSKVYHQDEYPYHNQGIPTQELWSCHYTSSYINYQSSSHVQSHGGPVSSIAFTPDGSYLLSISTLDRKLQLWDIRPGVAQGAILLQTSYLGISDDPNQYSSYTLPRHQTKASLFVTQPGSRKTTSVWVCGLPSGEILGYSVHGNGCPDKVLQGHLGTALCMTEQHSTMRFFSGDSLGMILGWGPC